MNTGSALGAGPQRQMYTETGCVENVAHVCSRNLCHYTIRSWLGAHRIYVHAIIVCMCEMRILSIGEYLHTCTYMVLALCNRPTFDTTPYCKVTGPSLDLPALYLSYGGRDYCLGFLSMKAGVWNILVPSYAYTPVSYQIRVSKENKLEVRLQS